MDNHKKTQTVLSVYLAFLSQEIQRDMDLHPDNRQILITLLSETNNLVKSAMEENPSAVRDIARRIACMAVRLALEGDSAIDKVTKPSNERPGNSHG